ncbi:MAG TPA: signal peptidase II [Aeromicrobium sp.]|nr:signal peptidase II [Aeromicrobium sp.]
MTDSENEPSVDSAWPKPLGLFIAAASVVVLVDQASKLLALSRLVEGEYVPLIGDLLGLRLVFNPGAALGTAAGYTILLSLVAVAVAGTLIFIAGRLHDRWWALGLGLFLGGAVGNLVDRLVREPGFLRGHVVDFIDYNGFFVGNIADLALTIAAIIVVVRSWQGIKFDGTREESAK